MMKQFENTASHDVLDSTFTDVQSGQMTMEGTINKTLLLVGIMVAAAFGSAYACGAFTGVVMINPQILMYGGMFGALGVMLLLNFKQHLAPTLAPIYAILEGAFLGVISLIYMSVAGESGIILKAVGLTVAILFTMLMVYRSGLIPVTQRFRMIIASATMGIMLMYAVTFVMSMFFDFDPIYLHSGGGLISIGLSLFIIGIASLNFLLDFDMIEKGVQSRAPKYMEWYGGFGLLVTIAWVYFEILRLLSILASSD